MKLSSLSILIPTYNNARSIERALGEALDVGKQLARRWRVVVVNDGSTDQTARILRKYRSHAHIEVKTHKKNQGYGATIGELYHYASRSEWMFTVPGDYQVGASELKKLLPFTDRADIIIGWRKNRHDPPFRLLETAIYNSILRALYGVRVHDVNSVKLIRSRIMREITLSSTSAFVDAQLVIGAGRGGWRIKEVPIAHRSDPNKGSGGTVHTVISTLIDMVRGIRT